MCQVEVDLLDKAMKLKGNISGQNEELLSQQRQHQEVCTCLGAVAVLCCAPAAMVPGPEVDGRPNKLPERGNWISWHSWNTCGSRELPMKPRCMLSILH